MSNVSRIRSKKGLIKRRKRDRYAAVNIDGQRIVVKNPNKNMWVRYHDRSVNILSEDIIGSIFGGVESDIGENDEKIEDVGLYISEIVHLAILHKIKNVGDRQFYKWANEHPLLPDLPKKTKLFRLFNKYQDWVDKITKNPVVQRLMHFYDPEIVDLSDYQKRSKVIDHTEIRDIDPTE